MNILRLFSAITIEPCVAIFMVAVNLSSLANQNLLLDKVCRVNLGHSDDLCDDLINRNLADNSTREWVEEHFSITFEVMFQG